MTEEVRIANWEEISGVLDSVDVVSEMENAFAAYSAGRCVVPPVGELRFDEPRGEVHIKYGYVRGDEFYVVKIASGFYANPVVGLPSSQGLMLLFRQETGELVAVLLDEGRLTDIRTAAAGAVAARYLAPTNVHRIGILGAGIQAREQLRFLPKVVACDQVLVCGRNEPRLANYRDEMRDAGFDVKTTLDATEVAATCNLIVTTTPSKIPLLTVESIRPGTHITAVGSDTPDKQELDAAILGRADLVVADSLEQCRVRGEIAHALRGSELDQDRVVDLGSVIERGTGRSDDEQITIADLTGIAVQDVQIASAVFRALAGAQ